MGCSIAILNIRIVLYIYNHYFIFSHYVCIIHIQVIDGNEDVACNKGVHAKHCSQIFRRMGLHDTTL